MNKRTAPAELRWFFTEAEGELGLRGMSLEPGAGSEPGDAAAERRARSCVRWSEVNRRLDAIPSEYASALREAYEPLPPNWPRGLERWYELSLLAAKSIGNGDVFAGARKMLKMSASEADESRRWFKRYLGNALVAFVEARCSTESRTT